MTELQLSPLAQSKLRKITRLNDILDLRLGDIFLGRYMENKDIPLRGSPERIPFLMLGNVHHTGLENSYDFTFLRLEDNNEVMTQFDIPFSRIDLAEDGVVKLIAPVKNIRTITRYIGGTSFDFPKPSTVNPDYNTRWPLFRSAGLVRD